jgi:hypothetical protein
MGRPYHHGNGRIQHRTGGGRFRDSTLADVGLAARICGDCNGINPHGLHAAQPETCSHCGAVFVRETCTWSRKREPRHLGPEDFRDLQAGAFRPCGQAAVANLVATHEPRCVDHVDTVREDPQ